MTAALAPLAAGEAPSGSLQFVHEQQFDPRLTLGKGDTVAVQLCVRREGKVRPVGITLLDRAEEVRERGIVVSVKDGFGFLESEVRAAQVYFRFSEIGAGKRENGNMQVRRQRPPCDSSAAHVQSCPTYANM